MYWCHVRSWSNGVIAVENTALTRVAALATLTWKSIRSFVMIFVYFCRNLFSSILNSAALAMHGST